LIPASSGEELIIATEKRVLVDGVVAAIDSGDQGRGADDDTVVNRNVGFPHDDTKIGKSVPHFLSWLFRLLFSG